MAKSQGKTAKTGSKADERKYPKAKSGDRGIGSSYAMAVDVGAVEKGSTSDFLGKKKETISLDRMNSLVKGEF